MTPHQMPCGSRRQRNACPLRSVAVRLRQEVYGSCFKKAGSDGDTRSFPCALFAVGTVVSCLFSPPTPYTCCNAELREGEISALCHFRGEPSPPTPLPERERGDRHN